MKKGFKQFLLENTVDHQRIKDWLNSVDIKNYTINDNGVVDVEGDVDIRRCGLTSIPVQFGYVSGDFYCSGNHLDSLKGCPREVGGNFSCLRNRVTSLQGGPREVGGEYHCNINRLTSLQGSPTAVGESFYCSYNELTDLKGAPREVGGDFLCKFNEFWPYPPDHSFITIGSDFEC